MLTPIALLVGSVGTSTDNVSDHHVILILNDTRHDTVAAFTFFGCIISNDFPLDVDEPKLCNNAEIASWAMSMATNAAATILIAYRTWYEY